MCFIVQTSSLKKGESMDIRRSEDRGHANHGWLDSFHSFSFADYHDPAHMGFGALRVINEDRVQPGMGFGTHGHRDMEIVSYVLSGALEHKDSMGNGSIIRPGNVQRMSAGTGVRHSEFNPSPTETAHFLQIWIEPDTRGIAPGYEEKTFGEADKRGRLRLIASPDGREGSVTIHQDAAGRRAYVHVARGEVTVNGQPLRAGDALKLAGEPSVRIASGRSAEVLVFDLA
jgi:quercetin 2,3-dioxygenase